MHSVLAPSKAARWMTCAGSVPACRDIPETSSIYADEGTAAHAVAAAMLKGEICADKLAALRTFYDKEVDYYDAINMIDSYVLAIRNAAEGKILLVEQHMNIEKYTSEKGGSGTADAIIIDLNELSIEVWDLKFGQGHVVWAADNPQTMLYVLGALDMVEFAYGPMKQIKMAIFQPKRDHVDTQIVTREQLLEFGRRAYAAGDWALSMLNKPREVWEQDLHPSPEACLFCPFAGQCPARAKQVQDTLFQEFVIVEPGKQQALLKPLNSADWETDETLSMISDWVSARREFISDQLRAGVKNPNWKLVASRGGNRKINDEAKVVKLLKSLKFKKEQIFESKLIPVTKLEKLVPAAKWPVFEQLISRAAKYPVAVSVKDKKPEWTPESIVATEFENVEDMSAFK